MILEIIITTLSLIAPILFLLGPVLSKAGKNLILLDKLSNKMSYLIITISNAVALVIAINNGDIQLSIVFGLWVIGMGSMFFLH